MFQLTIFDCDGTLVDSEVLANEVLLDLVAEQGLRLTLDSLVSRFRGRKLADCVAELEAELGRPLPDDFVPRFRASSAAAFRERLRPIDGAVDLVGAMTGPICVASSGPVEKIRLSLSVTGLLPYFEGRIFSSYDIGAWKPDPGLFRHAAQAMGVSPSDCAVVEDSLPGVQAGCAAGMTVFALPPASADPNVPNGVIRVRHLSELRTFLDGRDSAVSGS